jgi:signal peptidase II
MQAETAKPASSSRSFYFSAYLLLLTVAGAVVLLDQWTKNWVRTNLALSETWMPWEALAPLARVIHWQNSGAAFGLFQDGGGIFAVVAVIVAGLIIYYFPRLEREDWALRLAMGLQLGGALGNLIDRLQHGHVTDFISVGSFPIFNIADSSITVGVIILMLDVWLSERNRQPAAVGNEQPPNS